MKKYLSVFFVCLLAIFLGASLAFAETSDDSEKSAKNDKLKEVKNEMKSEREELKNEIEQIREEAKSEKEQIKTQIEQAREEAKIKMEALREKLKTEKSKVKAKAMEARITGREEVLKKMDNHQGAAENERKDFLR